MRNFYLFILSMLTLGTVQAQKYYPTTRATSIEPGKQYMIYDACAAIDGRYAFRASDGTGGVKSSQTKPEDFMTTDAAYLWTVEEISPEKTAEYKYYLKTNANTYAGPGGATNNANGVEIRIEPWATAPTVNRADPNCFAPDGSSVAWNAVTADMGLFAIGNGTTEHKNWNGNDDGGFAVWSSSHAHAFYEVGTVSPEVFAAYDDLKVLAAGIHVDYYALQTSYGVKDAAKYVCSNPETGNNTDNQSNKPISNLIDGVADDKSFYHTSWTAAGNADHYITVEMAEPLTDFYFYMAPRNANNRPQNVTISGSDDNSTFTNIATVKGISMDNGYISYKISSATAYKYLRFTVNKTNTGSRYFTLSEFYVLPSNADTDAVALKNIDLFNPDINHTVTVEEIEAQILNIGMSVTKKEAKALLDANASNYADVPKLGQYETRLYTALQTAYDNCTDLDGVRALEEAMANFKPNYAVYRINNNQSSYGVGTSVYDDGQDAPHFKTTDANDAQMLWEFSTTSSTMAAGTYVVTNIATGRKFWGANNIVVYDNYLQNAPEGVLAFKTDGTGNYIHAQQANNVIVRWNNEDPNGASAWRFTYVGDAYHIKNVVGVDYMNAVKAAGINYNASSNYIDDALYGTEVGKFPESSRQAIMDARTSYENAIGTQSALEAHAAGVTLAQVQGIVDAFGTLVTNLPFQMNLPQEGKAYKFYAQYASKTPQPLYCNADGKIRAKNEENITDPNSMIFVCRKVGDKFVLVNNAGKYLVWCDSGDKGKSVSTDACTSAYQTENQWIINSAATLGANYAQHIDKVLLAGTGKDGNGYYLTPRWEGEDTDCAFISSGSYAWWYDGAGGNGGKERTPLFKIKEVEYPNTPELKDAGDLEVMGIATWSAPFASVVPEGVDAYYVKSQSEGIAILAKVEGAAIPANEGVLLTGELGKKTMLPVTTEEVATITDNQLGNTAGAEQEISGYVLAQKSGVTAFYPVSSNNTLAMNRSYLKTASGSEVRIVFDFTTDGINQLDGKQNIEGKIYDLSGRQVKAGHKGLYIRGGKKYIVK